MTLMDNQITGLFLLLQVYEMYVAGYSFYLLNNIFTSHWGFQNFSSRPPWRARQMEVNNAKFDEFAKEVISGTFQGKMRDNYIVFRCPPTTMQIHTTCWLN